MLEHMFDEYRRLATDDLMSAYRDLGGLIRAAEAQRLAILAVLADREAHHLDGCPNMAQWIAAADAVTASTARSTAKVAASLSELPAITEVVNDGGLSLEQLAPLVDIATPESDAQWAKDAPGMSPAQLEAVAKLRRAVAREQVEEQDRRRRFRWWKDRHGLGTRFAGLLPDADAAVVTTELEARAERVGPLPDGTWEPAESRYADAFVELASSGAEEAARAEVIVQVPVGVEGLQPTLGDGTVVSVDTLRRLSCDATVHLLVENPDGTVAGYGRRKRLVPDKMRQRLKRRDGPRCRWPGCGNTRGLKAHHLQHWTADGRTDEDNCVMLCHRHHTLVHEGGWTISGNPRDGTLEVRRPRGDVVPSTPARVPGFLRPPFGLGFT